MESDMNFGVRLIFGLGLDLPFTDGVTSGLALYVPSSMRRITDAQKIANDSVVLIWCEIQSTGPYS